MIFSSIAFMALGVNDVASPDPIPTAIRGEWDGSVDACNAEYSTTRVTIGVNWISFYESFGILQISTAAGLPAFKESIAMNFAMAGEGSTWNNQFVLAWQSDSPNELNWFEEKKLEYDDGERGTFSWVRCS